MRGGQLLLLVTFYVGMIGFALHCFYWTPTPQPANGDAARFSEGRARQHVSVLTERIGVRSVSMYVYVYVWCLLAFCNKVGASVLVGSRLKGPGGAFLRRVVGQGGPLFSGQQRASYL